MGFTLDFIPFIYRASPREGTWAESWLDKRGLSREDTNSAPGIPLVNFANQYGISCFEGIKAYPDPEGRQRIFRAKDHAARFASSMRGLGMEPFPPAMLSAACKSLVSKAALAGMAETFDPAEAAGDFSTARGTYLRPFTQAEAGIGVGLSRRPEVFVVAQGVDSFGGGEPARAIVSRRARAVPGGTGWIKCASNYVIPALAKDEAIKAGFSEVVFLDARRGESLEEGSSGNFFFLLRSGSLVTPDLGDTILPGITRASVIALARKRGVKVEERRVPLAEIMSEAEEMFVTGTALGVAPIGLVDDGEGRRREFPKAGKPGSLGLALRRDLKRIQYGLDPDPEGWMEECLP